MRSYHFSLGNSSTGPVGYCARITADSPEAAVDRLKSLLPEDVTVEAAEGRFLDGEYIEVYLNVIESPTVADIDDREAV